MRQISTKSPGVGKEIEKNGKTMNSREQTHLRGGLILKYAYFLTGSLAFLLIFAAGDAGASVDTRDYPGPAWSPYLVGAAIGVLSWLTFYFSDKPIGVSSFYAHLAGFLGKVVMRATLYPAFIS